MNRPSATEIEGLVSALSTDTTQFLDRYTRLHHLDFRAGNVLSFLTLVSSAAIVIAGFYNRGQWAALLGIVVSSLIAFGNTYPLSEKAEFYRILGAEAQNLARDLRLVRSLEEYERLLQRFNVLNENAARNLPKGGGMEAVRRLQDDLLRPTPRI